MGPSTLLLDTAAPWLDIKCSDATAEQLVPACSAIVLR